MPRDSRASVRAGLWASAVALAAAGCGGGGGGEADEPGWRDDGRWWEEGTGAGAGAGGSGGSPDGKGGFGGDDGSVDPELIANVRRVLTEHCAPCHTGQRGLAYGGLGELFNVDVLIARGLVVPGVADASELYARTATSQMPPGINSGDGAQGVVHPFDPAKTIGPVSPLDLNYLYQWIAAGVAPLRDFVRPLLTGAELRRLIAEDAATVPAAERPFHRYVALTNVYASLRYGPVELDATTNAVGMALNFLSPTRRDVGRPVPVIDPRGEAVAVRVDLRDYDLDEGDWARIEAAAEVIDRQAYPCEVPFINFEQLAGLALTDEHRRVDGTVESVYSNIVLRRLLRGAGLLGPGQLVFEPSPLGTLTSAVTLPQLASALGVDLKADLAQGAPAAMRLCSPTPGAQSGARCAQRDAMPGGPGRGFWWTMDFAADGTGLPAEPVGPSNGDLVPAPADGGGRFALVTGEALWPWPNTTMGFATFDDQLRLRSSAAGYGVDPSTGAGRSLAFCSYCHSNGPIAMVDGMLPALEGDDDAFVFDADGAAFVERLFRPQGVYDAQIALDFASSLEGARASCVRSCDLLGVDMEVGMVSAVGDLYQYDLSNDEAAVSFYLDRLAYEQMLSDDPELAALGVGQGGGISRESLITFYGQLRRAAVAAGVDEAALNFCAVPAGQ